MLADCLKRPFLRCGLPTFADCLPDPSFLADCLPPFFLCGLPTRPLSLARDPIRKLAPVGTNWVSSTIAGLAGSAGSADGTNSAARFNMPWGVAVDGGGNVYVTDFGNNTIRKLTPMGTNWISSTIGGRAGSSGSADGTNSAARFNGPSGLTVDKAGNVYVADSNNNTVRKGVPLPVFHAIKQSNGLVTFSWSASPGQTHQLQYNSDLSPTNWHSLGNPMRATNGTISARDTLGPDQQRFYRVVLLP